MKFACTFCGCPYAQARKLVSGFDGMICDVCVDRSIGATSSGEGKPLVVAVSSHVDLAPVLAQYKDGRAVEFEPSVSRCSFCGKHDNDVRVFYKGHVSRICSECIGLCIDIMVAEFGDEWKARQGAWPEAGSKVG